MKKLSAAQLTSISRKQGLFDRSKWQACVDYLYLSLESEDPADSETWIGVCQLIRNFVDWSLQAAQPRGDRAVECLKHATEHTQEAELNHERNDERCIFSGRRRPLAHRAQPVTRRIQTRFSWWAHHVENGMECPHWSRSYVYEAQYSWLIKGMQALGQFSPILRGQAQQLKSCTKEEFLAHSIWEQYYVNINHILYAIWSTLTHL